MILEHSAIVFSQHCFAVIVCIIYLVGFVFRIPLSLRRIAGQSGRWFVYFSNICSNDPQEVYYL
jgi:hypothetical protein